MAGKISYYENKLRTRVSGLVFKNNKILLVKHNLKGKILYAPPGGGVEFGELMEETLKRELKEETDIDVISARFQFITEYVEPPLHAIEVFYYAESWQGKPKLGFDPELEENTLIEALKFYSEAELNQIKKEELHQILYNCGKPIDLLGLSGYINPPIKI